MRNRKSIVVGVTAVLAVAMALPAQGTPKVFAKKLPHTVDFSFTADILCSTNKAPNVTLTAKRNGDPGATGWVIFASPSGSSTAPQQLKAEVLFPGTDKNGQASKSVTGVGGNPYIYVETKKIHLDGSKPAADSYKLLGRCVQDFLHITHNGGDSEPIDFPVEGLLTAGSCSPKGSALGWSNGKGNDPIQHSVSVWLDNKAPDNPSDPRPHQGAVAVSLQLGPSTGGSADQKVNGIGGNPLVFVNLAKAGDSISTDGFMSESNGWQYAGRCKDLM